MRSAILDTAVGKALFVAGWQTEAAGGSAIVVVQAADGADDEKAEPDQ
jgi:hypothetical protein